MDCSHGFRSGRRAHGALKQVRDNLQQGRRQVYDADLSSYFDSIDHDKLLEKVQRRIADRSVLKLIRMWLKSPVVEKGDKGRGRPSKQGTPQGGVISPLLANIYLNGFDRAFYQDPRGPYQVANARLVRYADDLVILARYIGPRITDWVRNTLEGQLRLALNRDKTRIVKMGSAGESFDFLGFTVYWRRNRRGPGWHVASKTRKARLTRAVKNAYDFCRGQRHKPIAVQHRALVSRIRGHLVYFGVNDNDKSLSALVYWATRAWHKWLNRRSQRARLNWERFNDLLKDYPLPRPKVYVNLWASP